jgi:hypothetical protein
MRPGVMLVVVASFACSTGHVIVPIDDDALASTTEEPEPLDSDSTGEVIWWAPDHDATDDEGDPSTEDVPEPCLDESDAFSSCTVVCALEDRACLGFHVATGACPGEDEPLYAAGAWCGPTGWCCDLNPFVAWAWSRLHLRCVCA